MLHITEPMAALLASRIEECEGLARFVFLQSGDTLDDLTALLDREPLPEWMEDHGFALEAPFVLSDDGAGVIAFVPTDCALDASLAALFNQHENKT